LPESNVGTERYLILPGVGFPQVGQRLSRRTRAAGGEEKER
jgi:hypothetical protein